MRSFARRVLFFLILGIIFGEYLPFPLLLLSLLLSLLLLLPTRFFSLYLLFSSLFSLHYHLKRPLFPKEFYFREISFIGKIREEKNGFWVLELNSIFAKGKKMKGEGKANLFMRDSIPLQLGDLLWVRGRLKPLNYPKNPHLFDRNKFLRRQGFIGNLFAQEVKVLAKGKIPFFLRLIISCRNYCSRTLSQYLKGEERALLFALLFGEGKKLPYKVREYFSRAGIYHILAVSGLHIGIFAFSLFILLSVLRIKNWARLFIITFLLLFYLAMAGFSPSATRATIIFLLLLYSSLPQRKTDSFHSLVLAAIFILLFSPTSLFHIGFQLSFIVTAFILLFAHRLYSLFRSHHLPSFIKKYILLPLSVSFSSFLGSFPLLWFHFSQIPLLGIVANLIIIPLVSFLLPSTLLFLLLNLLHPALGQFLSPTLALSSQIILGLGKFFGSQKFSTLNLSPPSLPSLLWLYLLLLLPLKFNERRIRRLWSFFFLIGLNLSLWSSLVKRETVRITFLDTYHSEPILIEVQDKKFLILTGKWEEILDNFLLRKGIKKLAILFLPKIRERELISFLNRGGGLEIEKIIVPKNFSFSLPGVLKVERGYEIIYSGVNFHLLPERSSYNILFWANGQKLIFSFGEEGGNGAFLKKIGGDLNKKKVKKVMEKKDAQYFVIQKRGFHLKGDSSLLNTSSGAIVVEIGKETKIFSSQRGLFPFHRSE
ncbi:MAG: ComEC/Rec2 family competence protein [candidate division WOR-3 bacterium]